MGVLQTVAIGAVAAVAVIWLAVSFTRPGRGRTLLEWLGATGLYVALLALFSHLFQSAREAESLAGQIGFGLLAFIFGSGLVLTLFQLLQSMRGPQAGPTSATN